MILLSFYISFFTANSKSFCLRMLLQSVLTAIAQNLNFSIINPVILTRENFDPNHRLVFRKILSLNLRASVFLSNQFFIYSFVSRQGGAW